MSKPVEMGLNIGGGVLDRAVSLYEGGITNKVPTRTVAVGWVLEQIQAGYWYERGVRNVQREKAKEKINAAKRKLDYVTFSGTFSEREAAALLEHSGVLCLDFDDVPEIEATKLQLASDPYCLALFKSPTQRGLKMLVAIDGSKHLQSFLAMAWYYERFYGLKVDASGKDIPRACFVSADENLVWKADALVVDISGLVDPETGEVLPAVIGKVGAQTRPVPSSFSPAQADMDRDPLSQLKAVAERILADGLDLTQGYNDWQLTAFSCAAVGEGGREVFHALSAMNSEYSHAEADRKFDDALKRGRFTTPAWIFSQAKKAGIDIRVYAEPVGRQGRDTGRESYRRDEKEGNQKAALSGFEGWDWKWPKGYKGGDADKAMAERYSLIEANGKIWFARFKEADQAVHFVAITNFTARPLFLIRQKDDPKRIIELLNTNGHRELVDFPATALTTSGEFEKFIVGLGNFYMDCTKAQFKKIQQRLLAETNHALPVETLGYHPRSGTYAFSNGMVTPNGFVKADKLGMVELPVPGKPDEKAYYYLPALSELYKDEEGQYEQEKKMRYVERKDVHFGTWATHFCRVHGENGWIALAYYVAACFRDVVYKKESFFPLLFGFGPPGTGKSNLAWSMVSLFGVKLMPFNLNSGTKVGFHRHAAQMRNGIAWYDEYSNGIDPSRVQDLKGAYDGAGHTKGEFKVGSSGGNKTVTTPVHSALVVTGQELPTADNALFKRVILLQFYQTSFTQEETQDNQDLKRLQEDGLTCLTGMVAQLRPMVEEGFEKAYADARKLLRERLEPAGVEERIISNRAQVLAVMYLLEDKLKWPYTSVELMEALIRNGIAQHTMVTAAKETTQFWDILDAVVSKRIFKPWVDFQVESRSELKLDSGAVTYTSPKKLLFIRIKYAHSTYRAEMSHQMNKGAMDFGSLLNYLRNCPEYVGTVRGFRFGDITRGEPKGNPTSVMVFDAAMLAAAGVDLARDGEKEEDSF